MKEKIKEGDMAAMIYLKENMLDMIYFLNTGQILVIYIAFIVQVLFHNFFVFMYRVSIYKFIPYLFSFIFLFLYTELIQVVLFHKFFVLYLYMFIYYQLFNLVLYNIYQVTLFTIRFLCSSFSHYVLSICNTLYPPPIFNTSTEHMFDYF